jgi:ComF family protein
MQLAQLGNLLLPGNCALCSEHLSSKYQAICSDCTAGLLQLTYQCRHCAAPLQSDNICPDCQHNPPPFRCCIAPFQYRQPLDRLIKPIKTDINAPEFIQLSQLLGVAINNAYKSLERPQMLIPVPLHWISLVRRGFNQSNTIAQQLGLLLDNSLVRTDILYRSRYSKPQHLQGKKDRLLSMADAFEVNNSSPVAGMRLALIDDVVTTGATARAAASSLLKAGALSVDIWCIARTGWHIDAA